MHNLTKEDLDKLGRWNPKKDTEKCPEYMTRKAFRGASGGSVGNSSQKSSGGVVAEAVFVGGMMPGEEDDDEDMDEPTEYIVVEDDIKKELPDLDEGEELV